MFASDMKAFHEAKYIYKCNNRNLLKNTIHK